jgi:D-alanine-D-alanine ligase
VSLNTGHAILSQLPKDQFTARDIYIDKNGQWYERGRQLDPLRILHSVDVVLLGLHGEYGEDGEVQKLLEKTGVPFVGSGSFGSFMAMHKVLAKEKAKEIGLLTPEYKYVQIDDGIEDIIHEVIRTFHQPVVVKPVRWGSSVGVSIVGGYAPIYAAVQSLFLEGCDGVLIEELIRGREATVGIVEGLRGEDLYVLPVVEIIPPADDFYSYDAKYSGSTRHECPASFSRVVLEDLASAAKSIHKALGLRDYSRSDFIVSPKGVYYLETNNLPGITQESNVPIALSAVGISLSEFLAHLVNRALAR